MRKYKIHFKSLKNTPSFGNIRTFINNDFIGKRFGIVLYFFVIILDINK